MFASGWDYCFNGHTLGPETHNYVYSCEKVNVKKLYQLEIYKIIKMRNHVWGGGGKLDNRSKVRFKGAGANARFTRSPFGP
jgi:hypothetical protein